MPHPMQVDFWPFDLESGVRVTCDVGYLCANFSLPRPLCSRLWPDVRDRQMSDRRHKCIAVNAPYGWGHNNNNQIYTAPHGHNFRGAGSRSDQCSVKAWEDSKVLSLDLKTELLIRTVCASEFHRDDAENRKARPEKSVLVNGWTSSGMADER